MSNRINEAGFTLIEILVALSIFGLVSLALLRVQGLSSASVILMEDRAVAQIVARNLAVEVLTDPQAPAFGRSEGAARNAGALWRWSRSVNASPDARVQTILIEVLKEGGRSKAALTVFRRAA